MADLNAYLLFNGNCAEAMRFYQKTLGGKLDMMTGGESPVAAHIPPGNADKILHSRLLLDGGVELMASDDMANAPSEGMHGFLVSLAYPTAAEARKIFDALADGGQITMPWDKPFWSDGFGMLVDRFGTPWIVNGGMTSS
jgi:PhnB protein